MNCCDNYLVKKIKMGQTKSKNNTKNNNAKKKQHKQNQ